jgi:hypothetical protein
MANKTGGRMPNAASNLEGTVPAMHAMVPAQD